MLVWKVRQDRFSLPHALGEFYSQPDGATDVVGVMFLTDLHLYLCMYISCVVGVWEGKKKVYILTNQEVQFKYSTVSWFSLV